MIILGEVTLYNPVRAFGFVRELGENGREQFFHLNSVIGRTTLRVGDLVSFRIAPCKSKPGKTEAVEVCLQKNGAVPDASAAEEV